ncbi:MAG TPA: hypothetical protein PLL78_10420 [Fimbriimonadaceae bacterium]|nr:hypothetical protein [Fimbriimonadaceae bacterium]HRJ97089.1 hypothetical protein [Fimbriimonadaceae bacterium]
MAKAVGSVLLGGLSGTSGSVVFVRSASGEIIVRERVTPRDPWTPAQASARAIMTRAGHFFAQLTDAEVDEWERYARGLQRDAHLNGTQTRVRPYNAYMSLATRFLALHPGSNPPRTPPTSPFFGDRIEIEAIALPDAVRFAASSGNAAEVTTELLLQELRYAHGNPQRDKYRRQAFVAFEPGSLHADIPASPGRWAPAVRFLRLTTGQSSPLIPLPTLRIG